MEQKQNRGGREKTEMNRGKKKEGIVHLKWVAEFPTLLIPISFRVVAAFAPGPAGSITRCSKR